MGKSFTDLPFVEKIEFDKRELKLIVKGNWPNPSWFLNKVLYDLESNSLHVFLVGKSKGGVFIQIIQPFVEVIDLKDMLNDNVLRIIVHSREGSKKVVEL